jgi:putative sterol carrier protein
VHCVGLGDFHIDLKNGRGHVAEGAVPESQPSADVTFTVAKEVCDCIGCTTLCTSAQDLLALLLGSMNPLEAYMSGRLSMAGDTKGAMRLQLLGDAIKSKFQR